MSQDEYSSFEDVEALLYDFEQSLLQLGITIDKYSDLGRISLSIMDLVERRKLPQLRPADEDLRAYFRDILGLRTFMTKVVGLRGHPDFEKLKPHLSLMNEGRVPQNAPSDIFDDSARKIFELLIAMAAMKIGADIELEDPKLSASGKNPDVLITVGQVRYGLACKALSGPSSQALVQNLAKGIDQIEKSPAETGFVIFNVKNLIDHDAFWPSPADYLRVTGEKVDSVGVDYHSALRKLADVGSKRISELEQTIGVAALAGMFKFKKAIPAVVHFLQTATAIATPSFPLPTSILLLHLHGFGVDLMAKLNAALNDSI